MNLARTGKMKCQLVKGHSFSEQLLQNGTWRWWSFWCAGRHIFFDIGNWKQTGVSPYIVAARSSVASADPAHFSDIEACWHGLTAGARVLRDPIPKICLAWTSSQELSSISYRTRTLVSLWGYRPTGNSASSNLLGWKRSPSWYIQNPAMQVLFALPVFLRRTTRSWGNYIGDHWRNLLASSLPVYATIHMMFTRPVWWSSGTSRHPHRFIGLLLLLFCALSNSHHA